MCIFFERDREKEKDEQKREKDQKPNEKTSLSGRLIKKSIIVLQKHSDFHIFKIKILVRRLLVNLRLFHDSRSLERSQWKLLVWYVKSEISARICKIVKKKKTTLAKYETHVRVMSLAILCGQIWSESKIFFLQREIFIGR